MKKVIFPIVSIFAVVALVTGTAYALFSDDVQVNGVYLATGEANLKISKNGVNFTNGPLESGSDFNFTDLYPGYTSPAQHFWLRNDGVVDLDVEGMLDNVTLGEDWDALKDVVIVGVSPTDNPDNSNAVWGTLREWKNDGVVLPSNQLDVDEVTDYRMFVRVPLTIGEGDDEEEIGNEIADKSLTGMSFVFTGTQHVEEVPV